MIRKVPTTVIRDRMSSTMIITSFICTLRSTGGTPFHYRAESEEWRYRSGCAGPYPSFALGELHFFTLHSQLFTLK